MTEFAFACLGDMSGSKGDEAMAEYQKALEKMSARITASKRAASVEGDEVQLLRSSKRRAATAPSSSKKKSRASSSPTEDSPPAPFDWSTLVTKLNTEVFPSTPVLLASEVDSSTTIDSLQGELLKVMHRMV